MRFSVLDYLTLKGPGGVTLNHNAIMQMTAGKEHTK